MSETTLLESRVSKVEQDNRRLKLTVGALLLALAGVACAGAMIPEQIPEVIQARAFEVIDENGVSRAVMGTGGYTYYEDYTLRAVMNADGFRYYYDDVSSSARVAMDADGFVYIEPDGNVSRYR